LKFGSALKFEAGQAKRDDGMTTCQFTYGGVAIINAPVTET